MNYSFLIIIFFAVIIIISSVFLVVNKQYRLQRSADTLVGSVATKNKNGYGGGISVISKTQKQFVTMVQKQMFLLNDQGYIPLPNTTKRVWIDVGSHIDSFLGICGPCNTNYWPNRSTMTLKEDLLKSNDLSVIAIDPNINFYESLSKIPRLMPIIAAIYTVEGTRVFYEYGGDGGCNSLLGPNVNFDKKFGFDACHKVTRMTGVSTLRLETILSVIDPLLNIELLKVDAQGADLEVVKSGGDQIKRIGKIIVETQVDNMNNAASNLLYQDSDTESSTKKWMSKIGFAFDEKQSNLQNPVLAEYDLVFNNQNIKKT